MKKWRLPKTITITEDELKKTIIAGACSLWDVCSLSYWKDATIK